MPENNIPRRIGVISDTHGYLEPAAARILAGVDLILHAGDIDSPAVLRQLEQIAPVVAVRGNMDQGAWTRNLKQTELITAGKTWIYMLHEYGRLDLDLHSTDIKVLIHGHTHRAALETHQGVIYLNPGSPTLPRGAHNPSVAVITLAADGGNPRAEIFRI